MFAYDLRLPAVPKHVNLVKSKLAKASPSLMDAVIVSTVSRFCTLEQALDLETFFDSNPIPSSSRRIRQTVEAIRVTGSMLDSVRASKLSDSSFWA